MQSARTHLLLALLVAMAACGGQGVDRSSPTKAPAGSADVPTAPVVSPPVVSTPLPPTSGAQPPGETGSETPPDPGDGTCAGVSLKMKVLVLSADGGEASLPVITDALEYLGMPYDRWIVGEHDQSLPPLGSGCAGDYAGIILAASSLHDDSTGPGPLTTYERAFGVREVVFDTFPTTEDGFDGTVDAISTDPPDTYPVTLTEEGEKVFYYLSAMPDIQYAQTYLARPATQTAPATNTVLLTDSAGNALAMVHDDGLGRQALMLTFGNDVSLTHSIVLGVGLVDWVTNGLYIGEYKGRLVPQIDDLLVGSALWDPVTKTTPGSIRYRMTAADFDGAASWQARPTSLGVKLAWAFNGVGASSDRGGAMPEGDELTAVVTADIAGANSFHYINHTYEHWNLDGRDSDPPSPPATSYTSQFCGSGDLATIADCEIERNDEVAAALGMTEYVSSAVVSPDVSGMENSAVLRRLRELGVRYMVSDTSRTGYANPCPNCALLDPSYPEMLLVPRHATNLFNNVSTPTEWESLYTETYGSQWKSLGFCQSGCTYDFILDRESDVLSSYFLKGDIDPLMFHQANLRLYPGATGRSLLSDLLDATLAKVRRYYRFPVTSPQMHVLGAEMRDRLLARQGFDGATPTLSAVLTTSSAGARALTFTNASAAAVNVQVTGLCNGGSVRVLNRCIGGVRVPARDSITVAVP